MPAGKSQLTIVGNCRLGGSACLRIWQRWLSKAGELAVSQTRTSPKNSAWSVTAAKSSGRSMVALRVCCSSSSASGIVPPRANA